MSLTLLLTPSSGPVESGQHFPGLNLTLSDPGDVITNTTSASDPWVTLDDFDSSHMFRDSAGSANQGRSQPGWLGGLERFFNETVADKWLGIDPDKGRVVNVNRQRSIENHAANAPLAIWQTSGVDDVFGAPLLSLPHEVEYKIARQEYGDWKNELTRLQGVYGPARMAYDKAEGEYRQDLDNDQKFLTWKLTQALYHHAKANLEAHTGQAKPRFFFQPPPITDPVRYKGVVSRIGELPPGKHFAPKDSPLLGGSGDPGNFTIQDPVIHMMLCVKTYVAIRDLPPGTPIDSIRLSLE